jgi:hypothetical protein
MRSPSVLGRVLALLTIAFALGLAAPVARAQTFWTTDATITDGDVNDSFTPQNNQRFAAVDDSNNLYVLLYDNRNKTGSDNNFEIFFRRFTYNFGSPSLTRVTSAQNQSRFPSMAILNWSPGDSSTIADSGRVYMTWQDARPYALPPSPTGSPAAYSIFFRTYQSRAGVGFGPEIQVSPTDSINTATDPVIAVDSSHNAWLVWQTSINSSGITALYYAKYNGQTRTMGPQTQLTNGTAFSGVPSIAATRDGTVHLVWVDTSTGSSAIWYMVQTPGLGWSAPSQIVFSSGSAQAPSLTADYKGRLHLVWVDNRDGNNEIYYKQYTPGSGWDPVDTRLTIDAANQSQPYVDADPKGNVYVVWTDQRNGASNPDIFYKERKGGVWSTDMALVWNGTDGNLSAVQRFPGITHDGLGTSYVAWEDERLPASTAKNKEVFYKSGFFNVTAVPVTPPVFASRLLKTYPNPFNPQATIRFELERDTHVTLRAYDVQGRAVRTLVDSYVAAGVREIRWDGRDGAGRNLPSGTYFLRLEAGRDSQSRTVTLLK